METPLLPLLFQYVATAISLYFAGLILYRLFFHPLAKFPGPKLAAITLLYEAYFDVWQNGQYYFKIIEMHKIYGPIVRISPYELHVSDPAFFDILFAREGRWNKYNFAVQGFGAKNATICTVDHDLHKARRQPLNHFFSKPNVAKHQGVIHRLVEKLCSKISGYGESKASLNFGAVISAYTRDVANEYIIGKSYNNLDAEDFNIGLTKLNQGFGPIWRLSKHALWFRLFRDLVPKDWMIKIGDEGTKTFFSLLKTSEQDTKELLAAIALPNPDEKVKRTMVYQIVNSTLPPSEKELSRVMDDMGTVTGAGFETAAGVLRLVFYHIYSDPEILQRLRSELKPLDPTDLKSLEQSPYLTSVLMEGMRLSPAISARIAHIAPDRELEFRDWRIPAGTPVSMNGLVMHTDESIYPQPLHFDPNRWMDLEWKKRVDKTYAPFSRGTRSCVGMYLAWAEMYLAIAAVVQTFNFEFEGASAADFEIVSDDMTIGTRGKGELRAYVSPYQG